jgi:hypothetical protein
MSVKIFNGCSVFAGFVFKWKDNIEKTVVVSSGHVSNGETLWTMIASHVRSFYGSESDIANIRMLLCDPQDSTFPSTDKSYLLGRMTERVTNIVKQKVLNTSGVDTDVGNWFSEKNQGLVDDLLEQYGCSQEVVSHQEVSMLLFDDGSGVTTFPQKRKVKDLNSVMLLLTGINGVHDQPVGFQVRSKMDDIVEKRVLAEFTEYTKICVPQVVWNNWG